MTDTYICTVHVHTAQVKHLKFHAVLFLSTQKEPLEHVEPVFPHVFCNAHI